MIPEREDTFHAVSNAVAFEENYQLLNKGPLRLLRVIISTCVTQLTESRPRRRNDEQTSARTVTDQHTRVDSGLSAALGSLVERIVKNVVISTETVAHIAKAVIDNFGFIASAATLVKSEQHRYTDERAKREVFC